jgi:hypothetical protein
MLELLTVQAASFATIGSKEKELCDLMPRGLEAIEEISFHDRPGDINRTNMMNYRTSIDPSVAVACLL